MYAAVLRLSRGDAKALRLTDAYSVHRAVYGLFADTRSAVQKQASLPSGILYADQGGDFHHRAILILADRLPNLTPDHGTVEYKIIQPAFLQHASYAFQVVVNPCRRDAQTGKILAVLGREAISDWFLERAAASWGFAVKPDNLQVEKLAVQRFKKGEQTVTHGSASLKGELEVIDRERFVASFRQGIGRGRAFGFGLLQIVPL
ncbi:type I-E CRISPR-associated protein Cas6/Cse3/CasE [Methylomonas sp. EbA]|uniref:Type I-E CRISPR-associated protein Cas6/Cse3/CasE n=2 Tax=Methylomonas albis TaxID=1854563 RepID=A0ABR9D3Z9_9GAMM|nr:type I-E CRISPR-associated protein Cas6/Cse3/CasE [Methylomonas albis]